MTLRPLRISATAFSSACAVAPALFSARAAGVSDAASATSKPVLRHILVARFGRGLLGRIQHAHEVRRELRLTGTAALHFRLLRQLRLNAGERRLRIAPGRPDQPGRRAFLIVQQRLQQMLRRDPLMEFADRDGGGGLQKSRARSVNFSISMALSL